MINHAFLSGFAVWGGGFITSSFGHIEVKSKAAMAVIQLRELQADVRVAALRQKGIVGDEAADWYRIVSVCPYDSPSVFSLHCCITAAFQHVTTLLLLSVLPASGFPSITTPKSTASSSSWLLTPCSLSGAWAACGPPLLPLICLCTDKRVCSSSLTAKLFFWISNLSNQSRWRRSKARGSVRRGTARTLLRWPFMSMAAGQLPPVFPTETPPSPPRGYRR